MGHTTPEQNRRYYREHAEELRKKKKAYAREYRKHISPERKEARRVYMLEYRKENAEKIKKGLADYYQRNKAKHNVYAKEWNARNKEKMREMKRASAMKRIYGLSREDLKMLREKHNNSCAICGKAENGRTLVIDHNHTTGEVRGILCDNCNVGLGNFQEDPRILLQAIAYLVRYQPVDVVTDLLVSA